MKATCKSHPDIAFIKYWGKADPKTRIPQNNSISMGLSNLYSVCTIEFGPSFNQDTIEFLNEKIVKEEELQRIIMVLDRVRKLAKTNLRAKVVTKNSFPKGAGIASSGSGLSAVTMAACWALRLKLSRIELSKLARLASGTACRRIIDGFVEWHKGTNSNNSYSVQLFPPDYWQIADIVVIVAETMKKVRSTKGHSLADTSPFQKVRLKNIPAKIKAIKVAMKKKDFTVFGQILESEALNFHTIALTSQPPILYWEGTTMEIMKRVQEWRDQGLESYFTIDAGPTVHIICQPKDVQRLKKRLKTISGIQRLSVNYPSIGARVINQHLF